MPQGMGVVFRAYDPSLRRVVAVKRLFPDDAADPDARRRVLRGARAMARVEHPNVVKIFDVGSDHGGVFIAMELLRGPTLRTWIGADIGWRPVVAAFIAAGRGLITLHDGGLAHNDFKPNNVMFAADDEPRVMDLRLSVCSAELPRAKGEEHSRKLQGTRKKRRGIGIPEAG